MCSVDKYRKSWIKNIIHNYAAAKWRPCPKYFRKNMKLYIYPTIRKGSDELVTSDSVRMDGDVQLLFEYLRQNRFILDIPGGMSQQLHVKAHEVLQMILDDNPDWEKYVPMTVSKTIKKKKLFGYTPPE